MRHKFSRTITGLLLALVMALAITGCSGAAGSKNKTQQTTTEIQKVQEETSQTTTAKETQQDTKVQSSHTDKKDAVADDDDIPDVQEDGEYTSKEEVAAYLYLYEHLPDNYITKSEAKKLGWVSSEGNLWEVAPGKSIGGDSFGNREGLLPEAKGRKYYECDIDYEGGYRGSDRIIYSNDGLIYFTGDHYQTYELLYGEE